MTQPPPEDERFEHIPWSQLTPKASQRRLIPYALAAAVLIAGLTASVVRNASNDAATVATTTPPSLAATTTPQTSTTQTPVTASTTSSLPQVWSEADLAAVPIESLEAEAASIAEWIASDFFTIDGGTQITEGLALVLPSGSPLPTSSAGARSYVEWARAVSVRESGPATYEVVVIVRRLGAIEGGAYQRIEPIGVAIAIGWTEDGWSVVDLPRMVGAPLLQQAEAWASAEVPPEVANAAAAAGGELVSGNQIGETWRLVVAIPDSTGATWPLVIWVDSAGREISAATN